jgi:hypothetical protein
MRLLHVAGRMSQGAGISELRPAPCDLMLGLQDGMV